MRNNPIRTMTAALALFCLAAGAPCPPAGAQQREVAAIDLVAEAKPCYSLTADKANPRLGEASWKLSTAGPVSLCLAQVDKLDLDDCRLILQAQVKCQGLQGRAYLEMWLHFADGGLYFSRGMNSFVKGDSDWRTLSTPFFLKKGQKPLKATLNLAVQGSGTVWVDDLRLIRLPLK